MKEIFVLVIIVLISLIGVEKNSNNDFFMSRDQGNTIKGIAALLLVVVHIRERLTPIPIAYKMLATVGFCFVALFFFYSGYGIGKSIKANREYLMQRLPQRILYLIELVVISDAIYCIINILVFKKKIEWINIIKYVLGYELINGALWTVVAMIIIQIVILVIYMFSKKTEGFVLYSFIGVLIYIIITVLRGKRAAWEMQSCFAFVLGAYISENENKMYELLDEAKTICICILIFGLSYTIPYIYEYFFYDSLVMRVIFGTICSCTFVMIVLYCVKKFSVSNFFVKFLGSIYTEIYLWHGIIIDFIRYKYPCFFYTKNSILLSLIILVLVCGGAYFAKIFCEGVTTLYLFTRFKKRL